MNNLLTSQLLRTARAPPLFMPVSRCTQRGDLLPYSWSDKDKGKLVNFAVHGFTKGQRCGLGWHALSPPAVPKPSFSPRHRRAEGSPRLSAPGPVGTERVRSQVSAKRIRWATAAAEAEASGTQRVGKAGALGARPAGRPRPRGPAAARALPEPSRTSPSRGPNLPEPSRAVAEPPRAARPRARARHRSAGRASGSHVVRMSKVTARSQWSSRSMCREASRRWRIPAPLTPTPSRFSSGRLSRACWTPGRTRPR